MLPQKIALVTGTSSGFGKRVVELLLENPKWAVIASLRGGKERGRTVFSPEFIQKAGDRLKFWDLELNQNLDRVKLTVEYEKRFGPHLDLIVNNAGYGMLGPSFEQSAADLRTQFEVNFFSPLALMHALIPFFPPEGGKVINLSSICGIVRFPFYGAYCASKHALEAYTESMHYELREKKIQFCLVEPGGFRTEFNHRARLELTRAEAPSVRFDFAKEKEAFTQFLIEKKDLAGDPEKVAQLIYKLSEKKRMPLRVTVGADAYFLSFFQKFVPTNVWPAILHFLFQRVIFRTR